MLTLIERNSKTKGKKMAKPDLCFIVARIPIAIHRKLKKYCLQKETSVQKLLENYITSILLK